MGSILQSTFPEVKIYSSLGDSMQPYHIFSANSNFASGTNLISYSFSRSINSLEGEFSLSFKEDIDSSQTILKFYDQVKPLDIVEFYEDEDLVFIGVITNKSFTSMASGLQKTISLSGRSIEYLFSFFNISFNVTAMAFTDSNLNKSIANLDTQWSLNKGEDPLSIKKMLTESFRRFCEVAKANSKISNTLIIQIIEKWYGGIDSIFEVDGNIEFNYPIQSNMFGDDTSNYIQYVRNLLPENVYEIIGVIKNNKPKLLVREVPFDNTTWKKLPSSTIYSDTLPGFTLTKSIDEIYTAFYSYLEGSAFDQSHYENIQAIQQENKFEGSYAKLVQDKVDKYGYLPLRVNFCGFNTSKSESEKVKNRLSDILPKLNERIANWYGYLDEMYDANVSVVKIKDIGTAFVGEKIKFLDGEFYVTGIEHTWTYGDSIKINYHCERGGKYDLMGNFSELTGVTQRLAEIKS